MLSIILFVVIFFLPGACILWLLRTKWALKFQLVPGGSLWLAIPTSFAISVSIISVIGWVGYYLNLTFIEVKFIFYGIVILLSLTSAIKLWQKRQDVRNELIG
ncbi:MAG: hypothetical protein CVU46_16600, partial [Chloroflexi bacterium HGW-Chloroflexi-8]